MRLAHLPGPKIRTWGTHTPHPTLSSVPVERLGSVDFTAFRIEYFPVDTKPIRALPDRDIGFRLGSQNGAERRVGPFLEDFSLCLYHSTLDIKLHAARRVLIREQFSIS